VKQEQTLVFVCEHGSAKGIVAAAHFNRLAAERGLMLRAIARGTDPDDEIAPNAARGRDSNTGSVMTRPQERSHKLWR
jgi:hypothetical protein